jgi:imidazoleglycerol-phosphate dehydratase/histidinol-phosphatase
MLNLQKNLGAKGVFNSNNEALGATKINSKREELDKFIALQTTSWKKIYKFFEKSRIILNFLFL